MKTYNQQIDSDSPNMTFSDYLTDQQRSVNEALQRWYRPAAHGPAEKMIDAATYSLFSASKRLRPIYCLEVARAFSGSFTSAIPAAMALEMVHTYSLIHDDLPAMDDDDLRRGKPTNHKVYGEATAILAGDGLLTSAFEVLSKAGGEINPKIRLKWVRELSEAAGMEGMVLGQFLDMRMKSLPSLEDLENLHRKKTGALLAASVVMGAQAAEAGESEILALREFAYDMGLAFQIRDDVLDVIGGEEMGKPIKSDERNEKVTYVSLLGLEKAEVQGKFWFDSALAKLSAIHFNHDNRLEELTRFVIERKV
ncbi:MAG: polyprenyl synthetase family protein [Deltaproteobacteria bacterium]|nr:polyprenyl synthetase family protein [Deltaproteobacteria bacterium]